MSILKKKFEKETENQRQLPPIVRAELKKVEEEEESESKMGLSEELILLNVLLASKIRANPKWRLSSEDFNELEQDFLQLTAMICGQDGVCDRLRNFMDLFMPPKDRKFFQKYTYEDTADPRIEARLNDILDRVFAKIEPLWFFSLSLCRALTVGENPISPEDAWWLGLIDEVLGSPYLTRRIIKAKVKGELMKRIPVSDYERLVVDY